MRPYRFNVYLQAYDLSPYVLVDFYPSDIEPGRTSNMTIFIKNPGFKANLPIKIQELGGDGKRRNATYYISTFPQIIDIAALKIDLSNTDPEQIKHEIREAETIVSFGNDQI